MATVLALRVMVSYACQRGIAPGIHSKSNLRILDASFTDLIMKGDFSVNIYRCAHCGNIVFHLHDAGVPLFCCGEKMQLLVAGSVDAAAEKHVPAVQVNGNTVKVQVGSVEHPMQAEHFIEWIALETDKGVSVRWLKAGDTPGVEFALTGEKPVAVYAYCNLHGLWKTDL